MIFLFDTETSGLPDFNLRARDPKQPHIVQFAGTLLGDDLKTVDEFNAVAKPDGWTIPDDVAAIHGITTERANREGIPESDIAKRCLEMIRKAELVVAHNLSFDKFIVRIAMGRFDLMSDADDAWWKSIPCFCTMKAMTDVCRIPSPSGRWWKWPRLAEAYRHAFAMDIEGAHSAVGDLRSLVALYGWMKANQMTPCSKKEVGV